MNPDTISELISHVLSAHPDAEYNGMIEDLDDIVGQAGEILHDNEVELQNGGETTSIHPLLRDEGHFIYSSYDDNGKAYDFKVFVESFQDGVVKISNITKL